MLCTCALLCLLLCDSIWTGMWSRNWAAVKLTTPHDCTPSHPHLSSLPVLYFVFPPFPLQIANQLIKRCRQQLAAGGKLWEQPRSQLVAALKEVTALHAAFVHHVGGLLDGTSSACSGTNGAANGAATAAANGSSSTAAANGSSNGKQSTAVKPRSAGTAAGTAAGAAAAAGAS